MSIYKLHITRQTHELTNYKQNL